MINRLLVSITIICSGNAMSGNSQGGTFSKAVLMESPSHFRIVSEAEFEKLLGEAETKGTFNHTSLSSRQEKRDFIVTEIAEYHVDGYDLLESAKLRIEVE